MREKKAIRIIKREKRAAAEKAPETPKEESRQPVEREIKTVVSGWVRDHARRSEEFRQSFAKLLSEVGFQPSRSTGRA